MLKKLILIIVGVIVSNPCQSQNRFDIETITFKEDIFVLLKGKKAFENDVNLLTFLPDHHTFEVDDFKFGEVEFTNSYEEGKEAPDKSSIYFFVDNKNLNNLKGVMLSINRNAQREMLYNYIIDKYGEPTQVGSNVYFWDNFREGYTMLLVDHVDRSTAAYTEAEDREKKTKWVFTTKAIIIENDLKATVGNSDLTVLERIFDTYK